MAERTKNKYPDSMNIEDPRRYPTKCKTPPRRERIFNPVSVCLLAVSQSVPNITGLIILKTFDIETKISF